MLQLASVAALKIVIIVTSYVNLQVTDVVHFLSVLVDSLPTKWSPGPVQL